ncbi:hypothetical protein SFC42_24730, partial [Priestia filamentosa]
MKLITIVYENDIGMIEGCNPNDVYEEEKYIVDQFDFNNNSISDFIDYLDFQECEDYCYICSGTPKRIISLVNHLNTLT